MEQPGDSDSDVETPGRLGDVVTDVAWAVPCLPVFGVGGAELEIASEPVALTSSTATTIERHIGVARTTPKNPVRLDGATARMDDEGLWRAMQRDRQTYVVLDIPEP